MSDGAHRARVGARVGATHTYAKLELSRLAYHEIREKLENAGYQHAFDGEIIDMHGIAVVPAKEA